MIRLNKEKFDNMLVDLNQRVNYIASQFVGYNTKENIEWRKKKGISNLNTGEISGLNEKFRSLFNYKDILVNKKVKFTADDSEYSSPNREWFPLDHVLQESRKRWLLSKKIVDLSEMSFEDSTSTVTKMEKELK